MIGWLNTHSFFLFALAISVLAVITTSTIGRVWLRVLTLSFVLVSITTVYFVLRTGVSTHTTEDNMSSIIATGTPTLIEFYSDY